MKKIFSIILVVISQLVLFFGTFGVSFAQDQQTGSTNQQPTGINTSMGDKEEQKTLLQRMQFFLILVPAAISDSINPCEFAVMLLLLSAILTKHNDNKKVFLAGGLFTLAVFVTYLGMGFGLYKLMATASAKSTEIVKIVAGMLGVLVGLLNIKDSFFHGELFLIEVPMSRRPKMKKIIDGIVSPWGAFAIGIVISLFLLPCTSGPYITILGFLASESHHINMWGYIYLVIYNIIFILPMLGITILVGSGTKSVKELAKLRSANIENLHLVVGILMLGLGLYILNDVYGLFW